MINSRSALKEYLFEDKKANKVCRFIESRRYTWQFIVRLRKYEYYYNCRRNSIQYYIAKLAYSRISVKTGISIGPNCFGKGLYLPHYGSIICNSNSRFGDYCVVQCGVNISEGCTGGHHLYFSAGAKILKNINIPDYCIIGANAVLTRSIETENSVYAGIPAKKISDNGMKTRKGI